MDRWTLVISGEGPHHSNASGDVEALAAVLVRDLLKGGHSGMRAMLSLCGREEAITTAAAPAPAAASASAPEAPPAPAPSPPSAVEMTPAKSERLGELRKVVSKPAVSVDPDHREG